MKKNIRMATLASMLIASVAHSAGYTPWAVPTQVELVSGGVLIGGAFGDPSSCGVANFIFVSKNSTTFKETMAMALTAIASGKEMAFYTESCTQVGFHWSGNVINQVLDGHTAVIR